jgi:hypothetical protein
VAENGAWGYRAKRDNRAQAVAGALYNCNKAAHNVCRVYAVNNDVVYQRYAEFEQRSRVLLEGLKQVTFRSSEYGDELHDFRVPSPEALHKEDQGYDADTPLSLNGVRTIKTVDLVKMMTAPDPPILIDVLRGEGHQTIPGAYWMRGAGDAGRSEDVNAEVRDRLGFAQAASRS